MWGERYRVTALLILDLTEKKLVRKRSYPIPVFRKRREGAKGDFLYGRREV